ncbi:ketosynthase chain-length factor [Streptomyces sp. DSM 44915]|uniref:Ketosynthase chain-length factor n=1 Tax=Streptomyces chisholmiae TaxID=3075540 RepID=A0ABU2JMJ9_9ACTN|nr:ketosynthase chain-length factor [Streptomyces sp. DSM 44915]MDT0266137.1 ketosynthase chain-length factor [Streptomyces sp. DSM 44915]
MTAVMVTGLGVAAPSGLGRRDHWASVTSGRNAIAPISRFDASPYPARLAGQIADFDAARALPNRLLPQTDRVTQLSLAAADWALADAGLRTDERPAYDLGVMTASSAGGFEFGQNELRKLWSKGGKHVSAYQSFAWFYAVNTGQIAIRHGLRGPSGVVVSDHAGGLDALAQARRQIRKGTPVIVSGAVDALLCPWGWVAQLAGGRLSTSSRPDQAYLPFDARARGHVPGEGGAILVLEDADQARRRGARCYGELAGYGATFDPRPGSDRAPGLGRAIELALDDASVSPGDVDVVFADAAGLPELDRVEAEAVGGVFGRGGVPVTAPKTMTGRLGAGGAPLDVATALLAMAENVIPPTVHVTADPGYDLDLVVSPRPAEPRTAVVLARGQGGFNSAVVLRAGPEPAAGP